MADAVSLYRELRLELQREAVSAATCQRLLAGLDAWEGGRPLVDALGLAGMPMKYATYARHGARLADRDDALRRLAELASGSPWRRAVLVAGWLARWSRGDNLSDLPVEATGLIATVGEALSSRQILRIIGGDRSA